MDCFLLICYICIKDKDHQVNLKGFRNHLNSSNVCFMAIVVTLALGSRPRQGFAKAWAKNEA
jgi:hypothetical protein